MSIEMIFYNLLAKVRCYFYKFFTKYNIESVREQVQADRTVITIDRDLWRTILEVAQDSSQTPEEFLSDLVYTKARSGLGVDQFQRIMKG